MIYRFTFLSDEKDNFKRVFEADSYATFLDLHKALLASCSYTDDQMTSFFICNESWEKQQEVTLVEMESSFEYDNMTMADTHLEDLIEDEGQKLVYVFDPMFERCFLGKLTKIIPGETLDEVRCVESTGKAPKQLKTEDIMDGIQKPKGKQKDRYGFDEEEDFYGSQDYDIDELDPEGFGDLSFDNSTLY